MKTTLIIASAVIALWCVFAIGYHSGVRDNDRMWQSMVRVDPDGRFVLDSVVNKARITSLAENGIPSTAVSK
jgi:hypothetical protein